VELIVSRVLGTRQTPQAQWGHAYTSPTSMHKGNVLETDINCQIHQDSKDALLGEGSRVIKSDTLNSQET